MAKVKIKPEEIQEVEIIEEEVIQETELDTTLPAIPEKFFVEGKEYSIIAVKEMEERADKLIKKATPDTYGDKKLWDQVAELKQEAVKMRTQPENKRKEIVKPVNDFLTNLKSKTDAIGTEAKKVEEKLKDAIQKRENWEEEKRKEEEAAKLKRTNERIEKLIALEANCDPIRGTYSFVFDSGATVINKVQVEEFDDEEFNELLEDLRTSAIAQKEADRLAEEKRIQEAKDLKDKEDKLIEKQLKLRTKELNMLDATFQDNFWLVGSVRFYPEDLRDLDDDAWEAKIEESQVIPEASTEETSAPETLSPESDTNVPEEGNNASYAMSGHVPVPAAGYIYGDENRDEAPITRDPLAEVINENVKAHEDHQARVNGEIKTEFVFSKDKPFIEHNFAGTSKIRLFPEQYQEEATNINPDWVLGTGAIDELDLYTITYRVKR